MERSAGIVVYRHRVGTTGDSATIEVLLGHMGGPYWARKDAAAWTIPKGLVGADEDDWAAARREFAEETGQAVPDGDVTDLGVIQQNRSKAVHVWAVTGTLDAELCRSNSFEMEWPPKSGRTQSFPELDRFAWFDLPAAHTAMIVGQRPMLDAVAAITRSG